MSREYAPPPLLTIVGGATSANLQQLNFNDTGEQSSSSSSSSSSIIVIIVISSAIIVSATLYLLLRLICRHCHRPFSNDDHDDVVSNTSSQNDRWFHDRRVSPDDLISSLPLFTFGSVARNISGGDCAVCLSNFEPHDQLRLLPLCCHAFHSRCVDTWLVSNQTCPLCRSTVNPTESAVLDKILPSATDEGGNSFRIEIGNISRRREPSESGEGRRSYSIGSFEYIVEDGGYEVSIQSAHRRGFSDSTSTDKESAAVPVDAPPPSGDTLAAEVGAGRRSWLRDYVDRFSANSLSSRTVSFRSSGRFFAGSGRLSEAVEDDVEANRTGVEISEMFRWLSGV